jgi:D-methionine transport system ATP-binding protein
MDEPLVAFEGVGLRSRAGRTVLDGLDWRVPRGARVRIAAGRAEGGSLLLRLAAGLSHPSLGRVVLDGVPHGPDRFDHPFLRRGAVGWVPETGGLLANLTLLQNVALPLRFVKGMGADEAEWAARTTLENLGLSEAALLRPAALATQDRKLGLMARSALAGAELWLCDRPLDGLQPQGGLEALTPTAAILA